MLDLTNFALAIYNRGGRAYYAGGVVRDFLMTREPLDYDVVVQDLTLEEVASVAEQLGYRPKLSNENSYPTINFSVNGVTVEATIPRAPGGSMNTSGNPYGSLEEDSLRRDFTVNAMYMDILDEEIFDYHNGREHLDALMLYPVSEYFKEDPRRVVRAFGFISRFGFAASRKLLNYAKELRPMAEQISDEVWGQQFVKATKGHSIDQGMLFLEKIGWLNLFPWWSDMVGFDQKTPHHQETLWEHTLSTAYRTGGYDTKFQLAALFHDVGKLYTQEVKENGEARYPGHAEISAKIAREVLTKWGVGTELTESVAELVEYHMDMYNLGSDKSIRKLQASLRHNNLNGMLVLHRADVEGRTPAKDSDEVTAKILNFVRGNTEVFKPILLGRHVLPFGVQPGPEVGKILAQARQAQIDGVFSDINGALSWLSHYFGKGADRRVRVYLDVTHQDVLQLLERLGRPTTEEESRAIKAEIRMRAAEAFGIDKILEMFETRLRAVDIDES